MSIYQLLKMERKRVVSTYQFLEMEGKRVVFTYQYLEMERKRVVSIYHLLKMEESRLVRNSCIKIVFESSEIERLDVLLKIRTNKKEAVSKKRDSLLFFRPQASQGERMFG